MSASIRRAIPPLFLLLLALVASPLEAQTGTLRGRVIDGAGTAVANVTVQAQVSAQTTGTATTGPDGAYSLTLPAGTYTVLARRIGFSTQRMVGVEISAGATRELNITMSAIAAILNQVVVSATPVAGGGEKMLDAPAHVGVVSQLEVQERPSLSIADHLKAQPGVDVSHGGLVQSNIVSRGFNNAFSGSMLVLQDNRFTSVPSLRVNVPVLSPSVNEDIERIETLLGPAAALYGPNSANGVLHIITKSPFTSQGGMLTLDVGERSVLRGSARYAGTIGEKIGYKVSGERMQGNDWEYIDPAEPLTVPRPDGTITGGIGNRPLTANSRDFSIEKMAGEARVDLRLRPGLEWINTLGYTKAGNYIEITGANGAAQARNWSYMAAQSRLRWNKTFAQVFFNTSNSGNEDSLDASGTFLLRTGTPIVDNSNVLTAQLQHAIDLGMRQSFVVGGDYTATTPQTGGTINGRNENIDNVTEAGAYVHSITRLNEKWDFVGALRLDSHTEQEDMFFSPRAAIVFKPTANQNIRLTYNRAFSTPGNFSFYLDLPQARVPLNATTFYTIRALGVPSTGFSYPTGSATGINGFYMRSPFPVLAANPTATPTFLPQARIDAHAAQMYRTLVAGNQATFVAALLAAGVAPGNVATVFGNLLGTTNPTPAQVGTELRLISPSTPTNPFPATIAPSALTPVDRLKSTLSTTYEIGYKGILMDRVRVAVNGWFDQKENFTTPAIAVTPNAFMNGTQLGAYIGGILAAEAAAGRVPAAAVPGLATAFTTSLARVPVGTIMIEQPGVAPDAGLTNRSDIIFTYKNVDQVIDLFGTDMSLDILVTDRITLMGTYGWVNKTEFSNIPSGTGPLRINAPANKATGAVRFNDDVKGLSGEARYRYTERFMVNSGVYVGRVPKNSLVDVMGTYRLPTLGKGASISLSVTNLLDERVETFIGVPEVGRLIMTRLQYTF